MGPTEVRVRADVEYANYFEQAAGRGPKPKPWLREALNKVNFSSASEPVRPPVGFDPAEPTGYGRWPRELFSRCGPEPDRRPDGQAVSGRFRADAGDRS